MRGVTRRAAAHMQGALRAARHCRSLQGHSTLRTTADLSACVLDARVRASMLSLAAQSYLSAPVFAKRHTPAAAVMWELSDARSDSRAGIQTLLSAAIAGTSRTRSGPALSMLCPSAQTVQGASAGMAVNGLYGSPKGFLYFCVAC